MFGDKIKFPPLHINLRLMKQYVDKDEHCFGYLCSIFFGLSEEKLKAGIFDGTKIQKMIRNKDLMRSMITIEKRAWQAFVDVVKYFVRNRKADNYME